MASPEPLDDAVMLDKFRTFRETGDRAIRDELVVTYHWLAHRVARRFSDRGEPTDDLLQVAALGLVKAVERFDPEVGSNFIGFAMPTMVGEVRRYFRDHTWSVRVPRRAKDLKASITKTIDELQHELGRSPRVTEIAARMDIPDEVVLEAMEAASAYKASSLDAPVGRDQTTSHDAALAVPDTEITDIVNLTAVRQLLDGLPGRERRILYLRYFETMSQAEIAEQVGTSQVHVGRLIKASLERLRAHIDPDDLG